MFQIITVLQERAYTWLMKKLLLLLLCILGLSRIGRADDTGYWAAYNIRIPLKPKLDFIYYPELRTDQRMGRLYYLYMQSGIRYAFNAHLDFGVNYVFVRNKNSGTVFYTEHWAQPEITAKWNLWKTPMTWRSRYDFRFLNSATDRYRAKFGITSPWNWTFLKVTPYASHEIFYDTARAAMNQNRTVGGVSFLVDTKTVLAVYYMRQGILGTTDWRHVSIIGSEIRLMIGSPK